MRLKKCIFVAQYLIKHEFECKIHPSYLEINPKLYSKKQLEPLQPYIIDEKSLQDYNSAVKKKGRKKNPTLFEKEKRERGRPKKIEVMLNQEQKEVLSPEKIKAFIEKNMGVQEKKVKAPKDKRYISDIPKKHIPLYPDPVLKPIIRPKGEYSNKQWFDIHEQDLDKEIAPPLKNQPYKWKI